MPILPENRCLYPDDWPDVRERILLRAGNRCEQCDKPNIESVITRSNGLWLDTRFGCWRDEYGKRLSIEENAATRLGERGYKSIRVVLTIAHLDHDPRNCEDGNLKALCQRCHLVYDKWHHANTRRKRRERANKRTEREKTTGQYEIALIA